jgi:hypothetical protein
MRSPFRNRPAIALGAVILLAAASSSCDVQPGVAKPRVHWLIYLQSDFHYPAQTINAEGQRLSEYERCGLEKFDQIWNYADALIEQAAAAKGSLEIFANLDNGPVRLGRRFAFDDNNQEIVRIRATGQPAMVKQEEIQRITTRLVSEAKAARELHKAQLWKARQYHQNLFQAFNEMRVTAFDATRARFNVVAVFVSDMVHYNTNDRSQLNLETGHANMLLDTDRAAIIKAQNANDKWWVGGDTLRPLGAPGEVEMRAVLVSRCVSGEALPGDVPPQWMKIHTDVRAIWTKVAKALGAGELRWGYRPS